jgi:hypothetical protein
LRKLSTNQNLNEPQPLPENWGPIFGMHGFTEKLGDLSWLGDPELTDKGWFETSIPDTGTTDIEAGLTKAEQVWNTAKKQLAASDWSMLPDVPMTAGDKTLWIEYRRALREIRSQDGFPDSVSWPAMPE